MQTFAVKLSYQTNYSNYVYIVICKCCLLIRRRELVKRSAIEELLFGSCKVVQVDFIITNDDLEDLQAGYQSKTTICNTE